MARFRCRNCLGAGCIHCAPEPGSGGTPAHANALALARAALGLGPDVPERVSEAVRHGASLKELHTRWGIRA